VQAVLLTLQEVQRAGAEMLPARIAESVGEGMACAEDILGMVNSLLDVTRFEAGKARLRPTPAVLNDHVRATARRFAPIARARSIQLLTVLSQDVPVLKLDHELIDRTLANLIGNALKFTPEGSQIMVSTEAIMEPRGDCTTEPPFVLVAVKDAGEGIPAEYQHKIFEKFGQVESRRAGLKMSTGLGLTLCRYVVEAHGGTIWVESAPGEGSTFYLSLPVAYQQ
jgi:signal transduction histidine kinase